MNLIGEHIDYAGLAVLPMAIQREIRSWFRPRDDATIRIVNIDDRYAPRSFAVGSSIPRYPDGDWGNYVKAAAQGLERHCGPLRGFDAVLESTLPTAAGLSSSSALVVIAATMLLRASDVEMPMTELADVLADAERYVGTRGGGMDQAVCLGGALGAATVVEFDPLRLTPVSVPEGWRFIVASSLVTAEKSGATREAYNRRRQDCEDALHAVLAHLDTPRNVASFNDLLEQLTPFDVEEIVDHVLTGDPLKRFRHVVTEGARVQLAVEAMRQGDLDRFGTLMVESHASLRDDFEVSHAELNRLVDIAMASGAAGARLTGAGFGGCVLALTPAERKQDLISALRKDYYRARGFEGPLEDVLFVAEPSDGATVTSLS